MSMFTDPRKALCDNERYAAFLDSEGRVLTGRAATEVITADDDVAGLYSFLKACVKVLHAMGSQFFFINGIEISCGNDNVRIDVITVFDYFSFKIHS